MSIITRSDISKLAAIREPNSVSIFIPTNRYGPETINGKDAINLKNQLKQVRQSLLESGKSEVEVTSYLKPASDLLDEPLFWKNQSDGLAIFISKDFFEAFEVPVHFEPFNYISEEFYIKPLMPYFTENKEFYLLNLEIGRLQFYKCDKHHITAVDLKNKLPDRLEDVVGYDVEQKSLQMRSQQGNLGQGQYHGHSDEDSDRKNELLRYFRKIDEVIVNEINNSEKAPLVVACSNFHFGIYKQVNSYEDLYSENITTTLKNNDIFFIHEQACATIKPLFTEDKTEKLKTFKAAQGTGKTSRDIRQIIPAAFNGKIDTLFVENKADIFGKFDPEKQEVDLEKARNNNAKSLLNMAATQVMVNGGKVFLLDKEKMPNESSKVNALYRY